MTKIQVSCDEITTRNIGFGSETVQQLLKIDCVFVRGTGGMGGAAVLALASAGVSHLTLAGIDEFEISNLNRQVFAFDHSVGRHKAEATAEQVGTINPEIGIDVYKQDWHVELEDLSVHRA